MKKTVFKVFVTEFFFDPESEKVRIAIKLPNGQMIESFDSVTDFSLWCENNFLSQEEYDSLTKQGNV